MHPSPKSHANEEYSDAQPAPYGNRPIAPGAQYATSQALVPWSTGLFDCCSDRKNCVPFSTLISSYNLCFIYFLSSFLIDKVKEKTFTLSTQHHTMIKI
ncbi:hypothetical protein TanjilG_09093 [Lupinus angustifolius]|uniref:Uncharacterized protein n=1 Tax=Lupinus angustifolius TaxID=3871 RepID=A0A1J7IVL7_LUPAN|nr:hypothetical protein TanjilG_09093 [Lupinus angustifolius]